MLFVGTTNQFTFDTVGNFAAGANIQSATASTVGSLGASSGTQYSANFTPTVAQSGTAGYAVVRINPTVSSTGSGSQDDLQIGANGTVNANITTSGNQTNAGAMKALGGFFGSFIGNTTTATNLISGASVTNLWITTDGTASFQVRYKNTNQLIYGDTNGQFFVNDPSGNSIFSYSGFPAASDQVTIARDGGNVLYANTSAGTAQVQISDGAGTAIQKLTKSAVTISTNLTVTGPIAGWLAVQSKTANYSVQVADCGSYLNNNGAVGAVTNTLPAAAAGLHYSLAVVAGFNCAFKASGADTIRSVGTVSAGGGLVYSSTIGSTLHLFCPAAGGWWIDSTNGTWTIQ
jgi:hypothetical protein